MPITQRAIQLALLMSLGISTAWAHELQLADAGVPTWKNTGPVSKKKQQEANSGSWQPQAQPAPKEDAENPYNDGEDSDTYDDGDT
ncbi:hypothetical protein [Pseudomonas lurida]|uniref:hypothetical protein n=1 Tax=Pseudomonas lurida TaxID=244566 RepID=UPI001F37536E|nr:hypothetical protein [Pseudomonas lurida]MCF5023105.1 hypothetical protein [Pseudomonas lurida]MCF5306896.1 hypothetical protein [Pseudomonas lurida]MCF5326980.1 hypothetical protein [Pseudomonas lurida]